MMKRILIGLGAADSSTVLIEQAVDLAVRHQAEITGVTVLDLGRIAGAAGVEGRAYYAPPTALMARIEDTQRAIQEAIDTFTAACSASNIRHHVIREEGSPFTQLTALWRYHDLTMLPLRGLCDYGVLPDAKDHITRLLHAGVRPIVAVGPEYRNVRRVLVAYNGSMESANTLKRFLQLAPWKPEKLRIACFGMSEQKSKPLLRDMAEYCRLWNIEPETIVGEGEQPREQLESMATEWQADLIVMGSTARARLFKLVLGDTAHHMMMHADIPLFLGQ